MKRRGSRTRIECVKTDYLRRFDWEREITGCISKGDD